MDYTKFNVEDFASNDSFINWVNKKDPDAERFWTGFILAHPEMTPKIDKARALIINLNRAEDIQPDLKQIDLIWQQIQDRVEGAQTFATHNKKNSHLKYAWLSLACLLLICVSIWYTSVQPKKSNNPDLELYSYQKATPDYAERVNESGHVLRIQLDDGTVVNLENNSRLKYKKNYESDSSRDVYMLGEAFFTVTKNPYKPFIVHSNEVFTEVLGTSFRVKAREDEKNVVVSVKTGKVSVYALKKSVSPDKNVNGVILLPNQQVSYERQQQSFDKKLVDSPEIITPSGTKYNFTFENAPIEQVFKTLEDSYGIEIVFNNETMKNCFLTAPLGSEPLFEKLKIICQTIGANYEIIDAKVVISSSGC